MKRAAKQLGNVLAIAAITPALALFHFGSVLIGRERAFQAWSQAVSLLPGLVGVYMRRAFYRCVLPRCGDDAWIGFGTIFSHSTAEIGRGVYIGAFCCLGDITIEDDVLLGSHVSIPNGQRQHGIDRLDVPIREQPGEWPRITIGRDVWIGDRAVVLADVAPHAVVGAGSVVTRAIEEYMIAAGNPARVLRSRLELSAAGEPHAVAGMPAGRPAPST